MNTEEPENLTCTELGELLGKRAMHIGKIRNEVCRPEDVVGKRITPEGVLKICHHLGKEIDQMTNAKPDIVFVEALRQPVRNPRWMNAYDRERRSKVLVAIPKNRKEQYAKHGKRFLVERVSENGEFYYRWKQNLKQK